MPLSLPGYVLVTMEPPEGLALVTFDLDNVLNIPKHLGDIRWRQPQLTLQDAASPLADTFRMLMLAGEALGVHPVIVTNREATEERALPTLDWLSSVGRFFPTPSLYMREAGVDHHLGLTHKANAIAALGSILHIDDNIEVIDALQLHEVSCFRFDSLVAEDLRNVKQLHFDILATLSEFVNATSAGHLHSGI